VSFTDLLNAKKDNNNNSDPMPKKLGKKKLKQLMSVGMNSGRELLACAAMPPSWNGTRGTRSRFNGWKDLMKKQCSEWKKEARQAKRDLENLEELVKVKEEALDVERQILGRPDEEAVVEEPKPSLFAKMKDPTGHGARLLSASRIESVLMTGFVTRKQLMQSKMMSQPSKMVKLDFAQTTPDKVNVCKGVEDCFKPHRCMFVLQNEKNQTVDWKCLASSESITAFKKGIELFLQVEPRNRACNSV